MYEIRSIAMTISRELKHVRELLQQADEALDISGLVINTGLGVIGTLVLLTGMAWNTYSGVG